VSRDRLTLAAAALTRLTGDRAYGVNATLEARFSSGVPWRIDVTTYDAPVFAGATGTAGSFAAPAQFLGDSLEATTPVFCTGVLFLPPPP
jgi:endoglucanase